MAALVASGLLAACGTTSVDEYPQALEEAVCEWQQACHIFERQDDCIDALAIDRDPRFEYLRSAIAAGRIEYDSGAAASCFDAIRERGCEDRYPEEEPACAAVLRGRMGRNGPCMDSAECAGDGVCGFDPNCAEQCCVGACRVRAEPLAVGEPCGGSIPCDDEGFCDFNVAPGTALVCAPRVEVGGDCSLGQGCVATGSCDGSTCRALKVAKVGESCGGDVTCADPALCNYDNDGSRRCLLAPQLGAPCEPNGRVCARFDTRCDEVSGLCTLLGAPGAGCDRVQCAEYAECERLGPSIDGPRTCGHKASAGEPCGSLEDGRYVECLGDLQCEDGTCALPVSEQSADCPVPED